MQSSGAGAQRQSSRRMHSSSEFLLEALHLGTRGDPIRTQCVHYLGNFCFADAGRRERHEFFSHIWCPQNIDETNGCPPKNRAASTRATAIQTERFWSGLTVLCFPGRRGHLSLHTTRYFLEFVLDERPGRAGLQLPRNCRDCVVYTRMAIRSRGTVSEPQNETESVGKVIRCEYDWQNGKEAPSTAPGYQKCRAHRNCKVQRGESRTGGDECRPPQCGTTQARSRGPEQQRDTSKHARSWDEMTP